MSTRWSSTTFGSSDTWRFWSWWYLWWWWWHLMTVMTMTFKLMKITSLLMSSTSARSSASPLKIAVGAVTWYHQLIFRLTMRGRRMTWLHFWTKRPTNRYQRSVVSFDSRHPPQNIHRMVFPFRYNHRKVHTFSKIKSSLAPWSNRSWLVIPGHSGPCFQNHSRKTQTSLKTKSSARNHYQDNFLVQSSYAEVTI